MPRSFQLLALCLLAWSGPPETGLAQGGGTSRAAPGRLILSDGQSLEGTLEGASAEAFSWRSPLFTETAEFRLDAVDSVEFPPPGKDDLPGEGSVAVTLRDGARLHGDFAGLDDQALVLRSDRFGEVRLRREQVASLRWIRQGDLLWNGPSGVSGWLQPGDPAAGRRWTGGPGGTLRSVAWKQPATLALEPSERTEIAFRLSSSARPEFEISFASGGNHVFLGTWDDEVVLRRGPHFLSLLELGPETREVALRVFWDRPGGRGLVASETGEILGQWQDNSFTAGELSERDGTPLIVLGDPIEERGQKPAQPDGVTLASRGRDLSLDLLQVRRWDGSDPSPRPAGLSSAIPRVELAGGQVLALEPGSALRADEATLEISGAAPRRVPVSSVESLVFSEPRFQPPAPARSAAVLRFADGSAWQGELLGAADGRLSLRTDYSEEPLQPLIAGLEHLRFIHPAAPDAEEEEPAMQVWDRLNAGQTVLRGRWVPGPGPLPRWQLPGSANAPPLAEAAALEIQRAPPSSAFPGPPLPVLHLADGQALPGEVAAIGAGGDSVSLRSTLFASELFEAPEILALQYPGPEINPEGFLDSGWQVVRGEAGVTVRPTQESGRVTLSPGGSWGHPRILQGSEIRFRFRAVQHSGALRLRLFGPDARSADDASCTRLILAHFGDQIHCGTEANPGDFAMRQDATSTQGRPVDIRLAWDGGQLEVHANGQPLLTVPASEHHPRSGLALVFEPVGVWGSGEREMAISDFALTPAPGITSAPSLLPDAKRQALVIPRFRRDEPPRHALLAWNGDLLRGVIERAEGDRLDFRAGLETRRIPLERAAAAIWLQAPAEEGADPPAEGAEPDASASKAGLHVLRLYNGGILALKIDSFGPEQITGHSPRLGSCQVPVDLVGSIRSGQGSAPAPAPQFTGWRLEHAPQPKLPGTEDPGGEDSPLLGQAAPPVDLPMLSLGNLRQTEGQVMALCFWSLDAEESELALEKHLEMFARLNPSRIGFVSVNQGDAPEAVRALLERRGWTGSLAVALDTDRKVGAAYEASELPRFVLIDSAGRVAWVSTGYEPGDETKTLRAVSALLSAGP